MTAPRPVVTVDREALKVLLLARSSSAPERRAALAALRQSLADAPAPGDVLELDGVGILLDALGVALAETANTHRVVMVLDLEGAVSGTAGAQRTRHRFVMPTAVGAELVVALLQAGRSEVSRDAFLAAMTSLEDDGATGGQKEER